MHTCAQKGTKNTGYEFMLHMQKNACTHEVCGHGSKTLPRWGSRSSVMPRHHHMPLEKPHAYYDMPTI